MTAKSKSQPLSGIPLTPCNWDNLTPLPNLSSGNPIIEYFQIGYGNKAYRDACLWVAHIRADSVNYNVDLKSSQNPKEDKYFRQARIWWGQEENESQTKPLGEFIREFMESELTWLREEGGETAMMKKVYGAEYIYTQFWMNFALMRESGLREYQYEYQGNQCTGLTAYTDYRIWSYPHLTEA